MKSNVIFLICLILSFMAFGQEETKDVMVDVEEVSVTPPKFTRIENVSIAPVIDNSMLLTKYLKENVRYPSRVIDNCIEGTEIIQFTVTPSGNVTDFNVKNSVCREIDDEVIRLLKETNGMWKPGYNNGEPVAMEQEITMMFGNCTNNQIINQFTERAKALFDKGNTYLFEKDKPRKALRKYSLGVRYLPSDIALLSMRGMCYYALGNTEKAEEDWNRVVNLGGIDYLNEFDDLAETEGYSEMIKILSEDKE